MEAEPAFRLLSKRFALVAVLLLALIGAAVVWAADLLLARYSEWLLAQPRERAGAMLANHLRLLAVVQAIPLVIAGAVLATFGKRAVRARSLPPPGAWVVEGQRIRTGQSAVRRGGLLAWSGIVLGVLGTVAGVFLWLIAARIDV